jgi:hypothetical protein
MNSDVMSSDNEMINKTDGIYGDNRIDYFLFVMGMCANEQTYGSGSLEEATHKQVRYDVTQSFPDDEFVAALKPTQTELAQVHGAPKTFQYCQFPYGVEFILSRMAGVQASNIMAGINKNLLKSYDSKAYNGDVSNAGIVNNPNGVETVEGWTTDFTSLKTSFDAAMIRLRDATDITSSNYSNVQFGYTASIGNVLNHVDDYNVYNLEKLQKSYPNVVFREIPTTLEKGTDVYTLSYAPMMTFHRGALPSINAQEQGKYGKSTDTLFAYESTAVEVETLGALQRVTLTTA